MFLIVGTNDTMIDDKRSVVVRGQVAPDYEDTLKYKKNEYIKLTNIINVRVGLEDRRLFKFPAISAERL